MHTYSTLEAFRQYVGLADADTSENTRLLAALETASTTIERLTRRSFMPRRATTRQSIAPHDAREVHLSEDLLTLQAVSDGTGDIALADIVVLSGNVLRLINGRSFIYEHLSEQGVSVTGIWGYHPNYANAWKDSGDTVQDAPLSASATTITVSDATASNFQVGMLLRIEEEFVTITAVDTVANTLTVERGVRGTTAASNPNGTAIEIYHVPADVATATLQWAHYIYQFPDMTEKTLPIALLTALDGLRRPRVA